MSGFELVAGVIGIFFVAGIVLGVLIVTVLPMWRGRGRRRRGGWYELPPRGNDERPTRWPGS